MESTTLWQKALEIREFHKKKVEMLNGEKNMIQREILKIVSSLLKKVFDVEADKIKIFIWELHTGKRKRICVMMEDRGEKFDEFFIVGCSVEDVFIKLMNEFSEYGIKSENKYDDKLQSRRIEIIVG